MVEQTQGQHKTTVPELQWHIDLHGPVHLGPASPSAGAGKGAFTAVADRGQQQHSPVKPDSSADPAGRRAPLASEDRPATAADICRRNLDPGPLQRSASADIGWRMPQQPKPSRSSQEASRPGRTAPVAGVAASKAATQSGQRSRAGAGQAASRPAQDCQPHAQPSAAAVQESDPASLRRAKLQALKSRSAVRAPEAPQPQDPVRRASATLPAASRAAPQPSTAKTSLTPAPMQSKSSAAARGSRGSSTPSARVSYDLSSVQDNGAAESGGTIRCQGCDRTFAPGPYEKHERICAKVFQTKRKPLNMKEQRTSSDLGTEGTFGAPPPLPLKGARKGARPPAASSAEIPAAAVARKTLPKWKAQSGQLRAAMAASRGNLPFNAPPVVDDSLVPCPHCGRRFNEKAADRHIPLCRDIQAKPTRLIAKGRRGGR